MDGSFRLTVCAASMLLHTVNELGFTYFTQVKR